MSKGKVSPNKFAKGKPNHLLPEYFRVEGHVSQMANVLLCDLHAFATSSPTLVVSHGSRVGIGFAIAVGISWLRRLR